eukprot:EG_transcript_8998
MALTLELVLLSVEWGPSNPTKPKCRNFVDCTVYDRATLASKSYRLDIGGPPVVIPNVSEKENCFLWLRVSQEKKNLLGKLKQAPVPGIDHLGMDLAQPPNLAPNYRVPNDPGAKVNVTVQARWMGGKQAAEGRKVRDYVASMAVTKQPPKWQFFREEDRQWVDYSPQFCNGINQGLESGYTSFKFNGVHFTIDGKTGTHRNKKTNSSRPIRCVAASDSVQRSASGGGDFTTLGPFGVIPYVKLVNHLQVNLADHTYQLHRPEDLGAPFSRLPPRALLGRLSDAARLPAMAQADAVNACIPRGAVKSVFVYPLEVLAGCEDVDYHDPRHTTLALGGFIYLDGHDRVLAVNGLSITGHGVFFGERLPVSRRACPPAVAARLGAVVYPGFAAVGARRFAWLQPGEDFPGLPVQNVQGGMLFELEGDKDRYAFFAVQSVDPVGTRFVARTVALTAVAAAPASVPAAAATTVQSHRGYGPPAHPSGSVPAQTFIPAPTHASVPAPTRSLYPLPPTASQHYPLLPHRPDGDVPPKPVEPVVENWDSDE